MKKIFVTLVLAVTVLAAIAADGHGYNIYGNLFGPSTMMGVGFDSRFKSGGVLGYSVGLGFVDIRMEKADGMDGKYEWGVDSQGVSIPFEINAILGSRASKFEIGIGITPYLVRRNEYYDYFYWLNHNKPTFRRVFRPNIVGTMSIGYRLQHSKGFFMKLGVTLVVGYRNISPIDGVWIMPNICLGYTIPHF